MNKITLNDLLTIVDARQLRVWAMCNAEATHSLNRTLIGPSNEYRWTGTGPEHDERGNIITREVDAE
ncbi:MAG: hypothetical protein J6Q14_01235 [Oscillospiraceae bacterium]|nr:hypothetical protein [Oscillospiraceae bacterium]